MNYKRKSRRRFFLLMRSRTPLISSEFRGRGGLNTPNLPSRYATVSHRVPVKRDVSRTSRHCLFIWAHSYDSFMFDKDGSVRSARRVAEYTRIRNSMRVTEKPFSQCAVPAETVRHCLSWPPRTLHCCWWNCQIHELWERGLRRGFDADFALTSFPVRRRPWSATVLNEWPVEHTDYILVLYSLGPANFPMWVGFILSQATKAVREIRGIALLYFRPLH